jgi:hypothetical protein
MVSVEFEVVPIELLPILESPRARVAVVATLYVAPLAPPAPAVVGVSVITTSALPMTAAATSTSDATSSAAMTLSSSVAMRLGCS